jgi:hypothetical protein
MTGKDVSRGSLTAEQVAEYTDALTRHYGEPVRPVSAYCEAFRAWSKAVGEKVKRLQDGTERGYAHDREQWEQINAALGRLMIPIAKSNLLARLIYGGEKLRERMCPIHKGQWSGCSYHESDFACGCGAGANITGWLAESREDKEHYVGGPIPVIVRPE